MASKEKAINAIVYFQKAIDNDNETYAATSLRRAEHKLTLPLKESFTIHSIIVQNVYSSLGLDEDSMR